eukprot:SAG31_NODE_187_length_20848_cov_22.521953_19_plen_61_part_00
MCGKSSAKLCIDHSASHQQQLQVSVAYCRTKPSGSIARTKLALPIAYKLLVAGLVATTIY